MIDLAIHLVAYGFIFGVAFAAVYLIGEWAGLSYRLTPLEQEWRDFIESERGK